MTQASKEKEKKKCPTVIKRQRQNEKCRVINKSMHTSIRTKIKKFKTTLASLSPENRQQNLQEIYSVVDKACKNGLFKLNKAARIKSRLTALSHKS